MGRGGLVKPTRLGGDLATECAAPEASVEVVTGDFVCGRPAGVVPQPVGETRSSGGEAAVEDEGDIVALEEYPT